MEHAAPAGTRPQESSAHTALGRFGEDVAARWLQDQGYEIADRNWRCPDGELDLVAIHQGWWVAVEVKTRRGTGYGHPFEAITGRKLRRLYRLAQLWAIAHPETRRLAGWRVDAVSVLLPAGGGLSVEVLKDIRP
ncbi:YraN family protein [Citricoccus sp. I39-566]|uniref:YraN family protein n=1 Tax=Citricoccus sp. I39-566 TaxID=3073268 RepID=UPI00286B8B36|nr:YraN family protein [Citricoccus sp. I39-566]WMY77099.1 YraN family protein [Citricoccus sp. I39-566]